MQIKGVFEYLRRREGSFTKRPLDEVLKNGLEMLDIAATLDSATGGFQRIEPMVRVLDKDGNRPVDEKALKTAMQAVLKAAKPL